MNRWTAGLALIVAATLAACQTAPQKSELETKNEALEKRISELEGRPAVSAPPAPGTPPPTFATRISAISGPPTKSAACLGKFE